MESEREDSSAHKPQRLPLSRERVLRAALEIADGKGLSALSMRKVATALGVEAMSLYHHVASKADMLDGIVDLVAGEIEVPAIGGDWKDAMRKRATSAHRVLLQHPWAPLLMVSRVNVGPSMLRYVDATIGCLRGAGFSFELVDRGWNAIDSHVYGFTLQKLNFPIEPEAYATAAESFLPMIPADTFPHLRELSEKVVDGSHAGIQDFDFGLELILDGLERALEREK